MLITDRSKLKDFYSCRRVWQGIPGIVRTRKGRTFLSFYSGNTKETYGNYALLIRSDDGINYSEPIAAAYKEGDFRCFDPVVWIDPLDRLWFVWNVMPGEEVMAAICEDPDADELVWSKEFYIGRGIMMNKPTVLSTGEWLFPIAVWNLDIYNSFRKKALRMEDVAGSYVYKTSDNGSTFVRLGGADLPNRSFDEHMVYEMNNGVLRMLVRLKKGIGESYSYDRGKQWSNGHVTELGGPSSRFFIGKLRSGRVLLINHFRFVGRNNLTAFLSEDDGKTFPYTLLIDERANVSYPDAVESEDGIIHIVYDRERGCFQSSLEEAYASAREIITARITEDDILAGKLVDQGSYLKRVACKLGRLADESADPYKDASLSSAEVAIKLIKSGVENPIEAVFEKYPFNCANACSLESTKIDMLITRFKESNCKDEKLLEQIIDIIRKAPQKKQDAPIVEMVAEYIENHLSENIMICQIAEKFHLSIYYLSHIFKSITGTTITEYRNELRLTKAKRLLTETDLSITSIAQAVGFENTSYFSETFSRSEMIPPKRYRQLHKKEKVE